MLKRKKPLSQTGSNKKPAKKKKPPVSKRGLVAGGKLRRKSKPTGEAKVFKGIWDLRPHNCEICGVYISEPRAVNFSHLLPKGSYPGFRLDERNIFLKCEYCHNKWHMWGVELRGHKGWNRFFRCYDELHEEAYS